MIPEAGYQHLPGVFDATALAAALAVMPAGHPAKWDGGWQVPEDKARVVYVDGRIHQLPAVAALLRAPALRSAIDVWLDGPAILDGSILLSKPPRTGGRFPYHQDSAFYGRSFEAYVVAMIYLDDAPSEAGPLRVIPGTHRTSFPHVGPGKLHLPQFSDVDSVEVPATAGDVTLLSHRLVHASGPNVSERPRRTIRAGYHR